MPINSDLIYVRHRVSPPSVTVGVNIANDNWVQIDCFHVRLTGYDISSGKEINVEFKNSINNLQKQLTEDFPNFYGLFHIELDADLRDGSRIEKVKETEAFKLDSGQQPFIKYSFSKKRNYTRIDITSNCERVWNEKLWLICKARAQLIYIDEPDDGTVSRCFACAAAADHCKELRLAGLDPDIIKMISITQER